MIAGASNLAEFVAATAGRRGNVHRGDGGVVVVSPIAIANGYVNAAIPLVAGSGAVSFLETARSIFDNVGREFVLWVAADDTALVTAAPEDGGELKSGSSPAMAINRMLPMSSTATIRLVASNEDANIFGAVAERGYELRGLARLQQHHDSYNAPGSTWAIVFDGDEPVSVAAGFLSSASGGVYYVATPPEFRGRGFGAHATAWVTNELLRLGASEVTLQASESGLPIYERLGYRTTGEFVRFTFPPR